jgi:hypothetical protein
MVMLSIAVPGRITGSEGKQASSVELYQELQQRQCQDVAVMSLRADRTPYRRIPYSCGAHALNEPIEPVTLG